MLILAGIAVITITVALLLPEGGMFSMNPGGTPRELSESFNYVIIAIDALLGIVMYAIAIYSTLSMAQHLPNETFLANILAVLIVSAIIVAINRLPFAGFIIGIIVLLRFYELSISQLFMFFIFLVPAYVCTQVLRVFIFGFLAMLLT